MSVVELSGSSVVDDIEPDDIEPDDIDSDDIDSLSVCELLPSVVSGAVMLELPVSPLSSLAQLADERPSATPSIHVAEAPMDCTRREQNGHDRAASRMCR